MPPAEPQQPPRGRLVLPCTAYQRLVWGISGPSFRTMDWQSSYDVQWPGSWRPSEQTGALVKEIHRNKRQVAYVPYAK